MLQVATSFFATSLSPSLTWSTTSAVFQIVRNMLELRDNLMISVRGSETIDKQSFITWWSSDSVRSSGHTGDFTTDSLLVIIS